MTKIEHAIKYLENISSPKIKDLTVHIVFENDNERYFFIDSEEINDNLTIKIKSKED